MLVKFKPIKSKKGEKVIAKKNFIKVDYENVWYQKAEKQCWLCPFILCFGRRQKVTE